ncbi:hypothetical protein NDU88_001063 [Pleurodeles waltl]|uniref:Uncharacterized protein n=1 Tax=Pleurodeles waltl TaxID=8319 RepID=A0AAV7NE22_PLEWA|nr:hypothetical protein NDU88_001063 [Pleurodeles waltl]
MVAAASCADKASKTGVRRTQAVRNRTLAHRGRASIPSEEVSFDNIAEGSQRGHMFDPRVTLVEIRLEEAENTMV